MDRKDIFLELVGEDAGGRKEVRKEYGNVGNCMFDLRLKSPDSERPKVCWSHTTIDTWFFVPPRFSPFLCSHAIWRFGYFSLAFVYKCGRRK